MYTLDFTITSTLIMTFILFMIQHLVKAFMNHVDQPHTMTFRNADPVKLGCIYAIVHILFTLIPLKHVHQSLTIL